MNNERSFWRIIGDQWTNNGIIASDRSVHTFDKRVIPLFELSEIMPKITLTIFQVFGTAMSLFEYEDNHSVITSICPTQVEHFLCLSTTSQVIWLDDRYPKQPLLGWRHHRAFDRSLTVQTIEFDTSQFLPTFQFFLLAYPDSCGKLR